MLLLLLLHLLLLLLHHEHLLVLLLLLRRHGTSKSGLHLLLRLGWLLLLLLSRMLRLHGRHRRLALMKRRWLLLWLPGWCICSRQTRLAALLRNETKAARFVDGQHHATVRHHRWMRSTRQAGGLQEEVAHLHQSVHWRQARALLRLGQR